MALYGSSRNVDMGKYVLWPWCPPKNTLDIPTAGLATLEANKRV